MRPRNAAACMFIGFALAGCSHDETKPVDSPAGTDTTIVNQTPAPADKPAVVVAPAPKTTTTSTTVTNDANTAAPTSTAAGTVHRAPKAAGTRAPDATEPGTLGPSRNQSAAEPPTDSSATASATASLPGWTTSAKPHALADGLAYEDVKVGTGKSPVDGATVSVNYTGYLVDGTKFDSSVDRGTPFQFKLGMGQVIRGWDEGVATMKEGGKRKLIVPPDLGYGANGTPGGPIPPNAKLIFDVELLNANAPEAAPGG